MRSSSLAALVAASALALAGCGAGSSGAGPPTGGAGGQAAAATATDCNPPCTGQTVCVGAGTQGGVALFADGGVCPQGRHVEGNHCIQDLGYSCVALPASCHGTLSCSCAAGTLCTSQQICTQVGSSELTCVLEVP